MRILIFWLVIWGSSLVSLFNPFAGLTCYMFIAHAQVTGFMWGEAGSYGMVLVGSLTVGYLLFGIRSARPRLRGLGWMMTLWAWLALSTYFATMREYADPKLIEYSKIFILCLLTTALVNSEQRVKKILTVIATSLGLLGLRGAMLFAMSGGQERLKGPGSLIGDENEFALAMNMGVAMLIFLARADLPKRWRMLMLAMAAGCAVTVIGTHSRSGMLGLVVVALIIVARSRNKVLNFALVGIAALGIVAVLPDAAVSRYRTIENASTQDESAIGRLQSWNTAQRMVEQHPFFGVGPKNFVPVYPQYSNYFPRAPHNAYIALAAESGIPAALLYVLMLASTIIGMSVLRRRLRDDEGSAELCACALVVETALAASLVPNLFINRQDYDLIYHLVAIGAAIGILAKSRMEALRDGPEQRVSLETPVLEPVT